MVAVRSHLGWFLLVLWALMLTVGACGDDEGPGTGGTPDTGGDGQPDVVQDPTTDPGEDPTVDPVEDQAPDQVTDPVVDPVVDVVEEEVVQPPECDIELSGLDWPETYVYQSTNTRPVRLILEAVDFENDVVIVHNVSGEALNFDATWRIWLFGANDRTLNGISMAADARVRFHLRAAGTNDADDVYLNMSLMSYNIEPCSGEIAFLHNLAGAETEWDDHPDYVEAFILWGDMLVPYPNNTLANEAEAAGAWQGDHTDSTMSGYVDTCWATYNHPRCAAGTPECSQNDYGLLATGDVTDPDGWTRISDFEDTGCLR